MAKILVVDDAEMIRKLMSAFFSKHGITVTTAVDGMDGFNKLKADPEIKLVFADVNMPELNGLAMVEKIRNELETEAVILMLTSENSNEMKERGRALGVKGWVVKPFNDPNVINLVKKIVA